jgi:site-specific DNA recombinase
MCVLTRAHRLHRAAFWGCMTRKQRGRAVCPNTLEVPLGAADQAVLAAVERDVLCVEVLETALAKALGALEPQADAGDGREAGLREELARLEAEVAHLAAAIAAGGELPGLLDALQARERRRAHVRAELAGLERERAAAVRTTFGRGRVLDQLREALADWQGLLRQETGPAHQALRALLTGRLVFTPEERDGDARYTFSG